MESGVRLWEPDPVTWETINGVSREDGRRTGSSDMLRIPQGGEGEENSSHISSHTSTSMGRAARHRRWSAGPLGTVSQTHGYYHWVEVHEIVRPLQDISFRVLDTLAHVSADWTVVVLSPRTDPGRRSMF